LAELLVLADHVMTESIGKQIEGHGLSSIEWRILAALSERDGLPMAELARRLVVKHPTVTKAIDRMEAAQLVRRRTPSEDRRRAIVHLTERGLQLATPLALRIRQHEASIARLLGKPPTRRLRVGLTRLIDLVEQAPRWAMVRERRRRKTSVAGRPSGQGDLP
jgi:DNA-binding MarR family transcriptional regulator